MTLGKEGLFDAWDTRVTNKIDELVRLVPTPGDGEDNSDLVREMMVTALKTQFSRLDRGDAKILSRAMRELRYGFRVFKAYRDRRKVTIFGSARTRPSEPSYKLARAFARQMVKRGFMVITGAGPGIMKAGNEGAGKGNSFGVSIRLPHEQVPNEHIANDALFIDCRFFFTRKLMFVKEASAVALFPGGFGTHDEGMEVLTLVQTGKSDPMPILFVEPPGSGYWTDWEKYVKKQLLKTGRISPEDMSLFKVVHTAADAVREIVHFYENFHSLRSVRDRTVMRLLKPPSPRVIREINRRFADICLKGGFTSTEALPEENDNRELPRIMFYFDRLSYGRLRQLIDYLNGLAPR